jgi:hypothetical protein
VNWTAVALFWISTVASVSTCLVPAFHEQELIVATSPLDEMRRTNWATRPANVSP